MCRTAISVVFVIVLLVSSYTSAHPLTFTESQLVLGEDGTFQVEMLCDLDALALGAPQDADDAALVARLRSLTPEQFEERLNRLRELFRRRVRIRFDDIPEPFEVTFPDHGTSTTNYADIPTVLGLTAQLTGIIPTSAREVEFFASRTFSEVHLTITDETSQNSRSLVLERGARSQPFSLGESVEPMNRIDLAHRYVRLGFAHIVPNGLDHILFVLCLLLLSTRPGVLVWQVTAFTLAHALTLTLATIGEITLPPQLIEPLIAFSITWVAIENILTKRLRVWRPLVVFAFGLLHGFGFAGVLSELGLPPGEQALGLLTFNVGIELGQITVLFVAFAVVGWFRHRHWYRSRIVIPISSVIALIGLVWTVDRALQ